MVKDSASRLVRWQLKLADYEVVYKAERFNANANALSRNPIPQIIFPMSNYDEYNNEKGLQ